jgi:general secretion pathway protein C
VVRTQPVFANGQQRGFRVYPGRDRQMFARLGLQPGDLVLAINGTALDDPQRALEIFNTMASANSVALTVERDGQPQDLSVDMTQLSNLADAGGTPVPGDSTSDTGQPDAGQPQQ